MSSETKNKEQYVMEIQLWRSILCPYELAVRELVVKFEHMIDEHRQNDLYSPIEQVRGRVKSVSSILEKMQRKHIPLERLEEDVEDIAGIRIICQFEEDIETVAAMIQRRGDMEIKSEKDYLRHIKQSGYRSYHLIIYYTVETINGPKKLQVEVQIRTMAMNFWATIEHSLQYKYRGDMPEHVAERLSKAADAIISLDHEMSSVRSEIMDAQLSSQMQSNLVKDILNNIENMYKLSNKREVMKIQDEFLRVYRTKDIRKLQRFHRQLDIIAEGYRAQAVHYHV
jgi:putative GTP pyrophosphokinase